LNLTTAGYSLCFSGDWHGITGNMQNAFLRNALFLCARRPNHGRPRREVPSRIGSIIRTKPYFSENPDSSIINAHWLGI
jgi:hypothetical protein